MRSSVAGTGGYIIGSVPGVGMSVAGTYVSSRGSVPGIGVSDSVLGVTGVTHALGEGIETGVSPGAEVSPLGGADAGAVAVMSTALLSSFPHCQSLMGMCRMGTRRP